MRRYRSVRRLLFLLATALFLAGLALLWWPAMGGRGDAANALTGFVVVFLGFLVGLLASIRERGGRGSAG
jgi:uncharacterized membrane protein